MRLNFAIILICLWATSHFLACHPKAVPFSEILIDSTSVVSDTSELLTDSILVSVPPVLVLKLGKTGCYGECPAYDLKIYSNRTVVFHGRENTSYIGYFEAELSDTIYKSIFTQIDVLKLDESPKRYPIDGSIIPDLPKTYLELISTEGNYSIIINHSAPKALILFISEIERQINELSWYSIPDPTNTIE